MPSKMTDIEQRKLGNGYLRLLRSRPKRTTDDVKSVASVASSPRKEFTDSVTMLKGSKTPADMYAEGNRYMKSVKVHKSLSEHLPEMPSKYEIENIILRLKN